MRIWLVAYWLITGAFWGLGLVSFSGIGLCLVPIGLTLLIIGVVVVRGRESVAGILGLGAAPLAEFVYAAAFLSAPPSEPYFVLVTRVSCALTLCGLVALILVWRGARGAAARAAS